MSLNNMLTVCGEDKRTGDSIVAGFLFNDAISVRNASTNRSSLSDLCKSTVSFSL